MTQTSRITYLSVSIYVFTKYNESTITGMYVQDWDFMQQKSVYTNSKQDILFRFYDGRYATKERTKKLRKYSD
jgi:hypothetical protein